jgi:hypothetical protein
VGFQAILADGSVIAPAVDVLDGLLRPSQANAKYKGITGMCPHCQELRDAQAGTDNFQVRQALSIADLSVSFKRAYLDGERMVRVMHFAHRAGFLSSTGACLLCRDNQLAHHAAAVKVIGRWAERHWPGCTVKAEMQVIIPGAPPVQFRPDVSVIDATGNRVACIEYQRSKESFEAFKARDELRCSEFGEVLWFFRTGAYGSSLDHRDYLADQSRRFFKAFTDSETGQLQYQEGERPVRRASVGRDHTLEACSESSLLRAIDPPERASNGDRLWINTSMEMQEVQHGLPIGPYTSEDYVKGRELLAKQQQQSRAERYRKLNKPLLTVTDRVRAAVEKIAIKEYGRGMEFVDARDFALTADPYLVQGLDAAANSTMLGIGEIKRALRALRG